MRIGYVLKKFPRLSETFILNEILELERQGAEVVIFSVQPPDDGVFQPGLSRLRAPVRYLTNVKGEALRSGLREHLELLRNHRDGLFRAFEGELVEGRSGLSTTLRAGLTVAVEARRFQLDRLHAHFATVAARVARVAHLTSGIPWSLTCHAKDIYRETVTPEAFRSLTETASPVVTVCRANREHIVGRLLAGATDRVFTVYNGLDRSEFAPRNGAPLADPPLVLGVGRLVEKKGFHHLIEASAAMERRGVPFECAIVGDGEDRPLLENRLRELGTNRVRLLGARKQDEIRRLLRRATLLAAPCLIGVDGNRDALPTVILEALATGVPVVSTPIGGIGEILDGGEAGLLVPAGDPDALAAGIQQLLGDAELRQTLARRGCERSSRLFDLSKNVACLRSLWEERLRV